MSLALLGLGTALPATILPQPDALRIARVLIRPTDEQSTWLPGLYVGTGIDRRRTVLDQAIVRDALDGTRHTGSVFLPTGEPDDLGPTTGQRMEHYARLAPPLALEASSRALTSSGVDAGDITHLITVSCTGFVAPGVDRVLIQGLRLPATVQRTQVGFMGCHGVLNGLRVALAYARSDPAAHILLCAVELCSLHYHYTWNPGKMIANALFADGAAALVGVPGERAGSAWQVQATGSVLVPDSAEAMTWTIGDHGFEMTLARQVPALIARHLRPWLLGWLRQQGLELAGVRSWAVHPGGPRILDAVEDALQLPAGATAASRAVFAECGNMSSPTILFILEQLRRQGAERPCVALGFGPGLVAEFALIT
jgi:predicted naringenin-chalcone synthase